MQPVSAKSNGVTWRGGYSQHDHARVLNTTEGWARNCCVNLSYFVLGILFCWCRAQQVLENPAFEYFSSLFSSSHSVSGDAWRLRVMVNVAFGRMRMHAESKSVAKSIIWQCHKGFLEAAQNLQCCNLQCS